MTDYAKQTTILYVEDEDDIRAGYERALRRYAKELYLAKDGIEGLELYKKYTPDIVISDINMPRKNGVEMAKEIKAIYDNQAIIFTTAHTESEYTLEALSMQVEGYIIKPVDKKKLKSRIEKIAKSIVLEKENLKNQKILQRILDNQTSITVLTDFIDIEFASKSFFNLFGVSDKKEFFKLYSNIFDIFVSHPNYLHGEDKETFLKAYDHTNTEKNIVSIPSVVGEVKAFFIEIDKIDELFILTLTDITQLQQEKLNAEYNASHDKLTSLINKAKFEELLKIKMKSATRYKRDLCIAVLDIDHFKNVNDTYGHQIGDKILKFLAKTCSKNIRETDIFARWGGEEFALLMDETSLKSANLVCEKLRKLIEEMRDKKLPQITISIGLSKLKSIDTKNSFFKNADGALYKAKQEGRNRVVTHT